jgi:hypothetical protein
MGDPSLRLKNSFAQDDAVQEKFEIEITPHAAALTLDAALVVFSISFSGKA